MTISFVIGGNATGKSHFIKEHFIDDSIVKLDSYEYQRNLFKGFRGFIPVSDHVKLLLALNEAICHDAISALQNGHDVVVEQTLLKSKSRLAYIDQMEQQTDATIDLYIMMPSDEQLSKNIESRGFDQYEAHTVRKVLSELEMPTVYDGYAHVYKVTEDGISEFTDFGTKEDYERARADCRNLDAMSVKTETEDVFNTYLGDGLRFWHTCEVCGRKELLTAKQAFNDGWNYPPNIGQIGVVSSRTCRDCDMTDTLFWRQQNNEPLSEKDRSLIKRIQLEPLSFLWRL